MQIFEFHFSPPKQSELTSGQAKLTFDSFCYQPENIYEKRLGSLYMVGELRNFLPQNLHFLDNLARTIKNKYYNLPFISLEKSLKESLKEANEFLEKVAKSGDVSWLGNLSFAVLSVKEFSLNFTKVGDLKIFLLKEGQVIDIDQELKFQEIEPYPLKIFGNIISGKLAEDDIILVLTKEIFNFFQSPTGKVNSVREQSQNLLNEIAQISPFNQKELKRILNGKKEELLKIPGVCLLISLSKGLEREEKEVFEAKFSPKEFSFKEVFSPFVKVLKRLKINLKGVISKLYFKLKIPRFKLPELRLSSPKFLKIKSFKVKINFRALNKNLILILVLILFLTLGFFIFQKREEQKLKDYQATLEVAQEKVIQAESFLILKETNPQAIQKANALFKEAWEEISPLVKIAPTLPSDLSNQVFSLEESIKKNLYQLNKLTEISEPELVFNFEESEFIPQKMLMVGEALYFFNPYTQNIYRLEGEEEKKIETDQKFNLATVIDSSIIFFQKPDKLIPFKEDRFGEVIFLESPYPDFDFNNFSSYKSNLYFLDKKSGEITKYPYLGDLEWGSPQLWLNSTTEKLIGAKSLAIDGSIWVLEKEKTINRYYGGRYQATLKLDLFPDSKNFSKIFTSPSLFYLYILEPSEKRIIITDKEGRVLEQFQSQAFDNLKDFGISKDGKTIYLLNGSKVYKIEF